MEEVVTALTMPVLLTSVGNILSSMVDWAGTAATAIASNPMLLLGVGISFAGAGIGTLKRLFRV